GRNSGGQPALRYDFGRSVSGFNRSRAPGISFRANLAAGDRSSKQSPKDKPLAGKSLDPFQKGSTNPLLRLLASIGRGRGTWKVRERMGPGRYPATRRGNPLRRPFRIATRGHFLH